MHRLKLVSFIVKIHTHLYTHTHLKKKKQASTITSSVIVYLFTEAVGFEQQVLIITVTLYITKVIRCLSRLVYELKQSSNAI